MSTSVQVLEASGVGRLRRAGMAAAVLAIVLVASFVHYLIHNQYPLLRIEAAAASGLLILFAVVFGCLHAAVGRWSAALLEGTVVFLAVDLNADNLWLATGLGVFVAAASISLRRSMLPPLGAMFSAILVLDLAGLALVRPVLAEALTEDRRRSDLPVVLHLILDEHIGIEGLPADMPGGGEIRGELTSFYASNGFQLFGGAYSEHLHTVNAIPQALNFGRAQPPTPDQKMSGVRLRSNAWFDRLASQGYRLHVYQSDYVDYCRHGAVVSCSDYTVAGLEDVAGAPLPPRDKARLALFGFLSLSEAILGGARTYDRVTRDARAHGIPLQPFDLEFRSKVSTVNALAAFDKLIADLKSAEPGEAYFAHILAPHYPYLADRHCRLLPADRWIMRRSALSLRQRNAAYFEQIRCTTSKVAAALQALGQSPAGRRTIILVHGDHGSRITRVDPGSHRVGQFSDADVIAGHSTLFAFRPLAAAPSYDPAPASLPALLGSVAASDLAAPQAPARSRPPIVYLSDRNWRPTQRRDLPVSWPDPM